MNQVKINAPTPFKLSSNYLDLAQSDLLSLIESDES